MELIQVLEHQGVEGNEKTDEFLLLLGNMQSNLKILLNKKMNSNEVKPKCLYDTVTGTDKPPLNGINIGSGTLGCREQ